ncbi:MAG TPA: response regulator [Terriglobales bacterium]|nr:response regulator [Terriglobales bacterium]
MTPQPKRLLFVEDEPETLQELPKVLASAGFSVSIANSVTEALTRMFSERFDILISDLNIEAPRDGYKLVAAIRETNSLALSVIITAESAVDAALSAIRHKVDDYFIKPVDPDALLRSLHEKLSARRPKARILSVSYDESLLRTRQILLQREGYDVVSTRGFTESLKRCQEGGFDIFILGHSIPVSDKEHLIQAFHEKCPGPVVSLRRSIGEQKLDGAEYHIDPDPEELLRLISQIVSKVVRDRAA